MGGVCWLVGGPNCRLPTCPQTRPKGGTDRNRASSQHDQGPSFGGSRSKAERRERDQPKPTLPFPYRFTPHNRLIRQTLDGGAHSDVSPAFAQRIAGTNGHPTPASAKAKTHGRYHLIRTTISPDALIGPWRSAPFVHPCRPGAPIHPFRLHSTEDPYPQCLLPSSSSFSTLDPVSRSHQASIDNSTSLTDLSNIHLHFLPYQSHLSFSSLLPPFALIISHFATHQFDHPTHHQPTNHPRNPYFLPAPVILVPRSFSPSAHQRLPPARIPIRHRHLSLGVPVSCIQPLDPELRVLVHCGQDINRVSSQVRKADWHPSVFPHNLSTKSQGGSCRQILFTAPLHQPTANSTRFHSFPAVS